ncbi:transcriptional regulator FilR1 domain-containing protein [Methanolobus halotolerans]|uniref:Methanogenesis regulatory protein FilR1 middle domain-containing protein n=1 Tax=Methanolobus halotolerans TaxID=2052935 RepID=A0A4E0PYB5_9EURY|nr:hypothetical protein [Methanolobus halotolerans]TGC08506.1 hypothetical protein CUN85_09330 [Methanolobus halotolerans]
MKIDHYNINPISPGPIDIDIYNINQELFKRSLDSKSVNFICRFLYPNFEYLALKWIEDQAEVSIIADTELLQKIKENHAGKFNHSLNSGLIRLFLYSGKINFMKSVQSDHSAMLLLFNEEMRYDNKHPLSFNPGSFDGGKRSLIIIDDYPYP